MNQERTFWEYNYEDIQYMGLDTFATYLSDENHSLVLIYRLLTLRDIFEQNEEFEFCKIIQDYFIKHDVHFDDEQE